jgi:UDP-N-acetylglucosamine transferase subunit ALG13
MTCAGAQGRNVVVSVGTDHHRFDRLMDWLESWMLNSGGDASVTVQHGSSRCPNGASGFTFLPKFDLLDLISSADVVLLQGGPGGIMDSRRAGRLPIVVPRLASLKECVDDHQVTFARHMAELGKVIFVDTEAGLHAALDRVLAAPAAFRIRQDDDDHITATVDRFGSLVDNLLGVPAPVGRRVASPIATMSTAS